MLRTRRKLAAVIERFVNARHGKGSTEARATGQADSGKVGLWEHDIPTFPCSSDSLGADRHHYKPEEMAYTPTCTRMADYRIDNRDDSSIRVERRLEEDWIRCGRLGSDPVAGDWGLVRGTEASSKKISGNRNTHV